MDTKRVWFCLFQMIFSTIVQLCLRRNCPSMHLRAKSRGCNSGPYRRAVIIHLNATLCVTLPHLTCLTTNTHLTLCQVRRSLSHFFYDGTWVNRFSNNCEMPREVDLTKFPYSSAMIKKKWGANMIKMLLFLECWCTWKLGNGCWDVLCIHRDTKGLKLAGIFVWAELTFILSSNWAVILQLLHWHMTKHVICWMYSPLCSLHCFCC